MLAEHRTPTSSAPARRTARSNLYSVLAKECARARPTFGPPSRTKRALAPYSEAELAAYLALADAQPTLARRHAPSGLIALGAGAGLAGADLRLVAGDHVVERSGGVLVSVSGRCPWVVPVRAELAARALGRLPGLAQASSWAGPSPPDAT